MDELTWNVERQVWEGYDPVSGLGIRVTGGAMLGELVQIGKTLRTERGWTGVLTDAQMAQYKTRQQAAWTAAYWRAKAQ
jgi:hypothetical protein